MTPAEQAAEFKRLTQELIDAGKLSPTEADDALDALVKRSIKEHGA
jgi:polyhydroxyalkanoate synthesis regulator phasin